MRNPKFPTIKALAEIVRALKADIRDDYRAYPDDDSNVPSMLVTIGADGEGVHRWTYQTGDNSFSGGAYGYPIWAVVAITRRSNSVQVARDITDQLHDAFADRRES